MQRLFCTLFTAASLPTHDSVLPAGFCPIIRLMVSGLSCSSGTGIKTLSSLFGTTCLSHAEFLTVFLFSPLSPSVNCQTVLEPSKDVGR